MESTILPWSTEANDVPAGTEPVAIMMFRAATLYPPVRLRTCRRYLYLVVTQEFALALQPVYPVLFEQSGDAPGHFLHDPVFPGQHLMDVHFYTGDVDAVLGRLLFDEGVMMGGIQQRLGRNTSRIQAGSAQVGLAVTAQPVIHTGRIKSQLCTADRTDVTAGAGAYDYHVIIFHVGVRFVTAGVTGLPVILSSPPGKIRLPVHR